MTEARGSIDGGCGCFSLIVLILVCWALLFGVTWNDKHHSLGCSCDRGVVVK